MRPAVLAVLVLVVAVGACGGDELTLTEYVDEVNALVANARSQYEEMVAEGDGELLFAQGEELLDYTPQDLHALLERIAVLGDEVLGEARALEPPELIADLHDFWFEVDDEGFTKAQQALAVRAETAADWYELSDTTEMAAYREALVADKAACIEFQAKLDATEERGAFEDTPWVPGELKEVVNVLLGCEGYPENPEDSFLPPPRS